VAAELAKAVQRTGSLPETQQAAMAELAKVKPYEQTLLPPADPRSAAQQVLVAVFLHGDDVAPLEPHVTQQRREAYQAIGSGLKRALDKMRAQFVAARLPSGALFDTMMSLAEFSKEGEDAFGYRIQVGEAGVPLPTFYVVGDPGHYKVLATSWAPESLGRRAIELLKKGDTKTARRWLDWIAADSNATSNEKSPAGQLIRYLWTGGNESPLTAAASLVAKYGGSDEAIQILKQARQSSTISTERGQIDLALCEGYAQARRWADLLAAAQQASATFSVAEQGFAFVMKARAELKQWSGLEQDALQKLKKSADDGNALRAAALAAIGMGDHGKAAQYLKRLNEREYAGREAHALNAWNALLLGKVDEGMLQAVKKDQAYGSDASAFYLTGMLETALGKPEDAQQSLGRGLELEEANQLDAKAWVLFGRIQEQYGMPEAATAAYGRARSAPRADETSGWALGIIPGAR
jgi:tetratricopeptide (TPR) repeat protein